MKTLGYIVMLIGCVMLLGFVGHDELHGGDFKATVVKLLAAALVVAAGLFLSGVKHADRKL